MSFIDKLIENTRKGDLDFIWQYSKQGNKFRYKAEKDLLADLSFSLDDIVTKTVTKENGKTKEVPDNSKGLIIFPNGAGMEVDRSKLEELYQECSNAILRAMFSLATDYNAGIVQIQEEDTTSSDSNKTTIS